MILLNRDIRLLRLPALVIDKSAFVLTFLVALACLLQSSFEAAASWPPAVRCLSLNRPYLLAGPLQAAQQCATGLAATTAAWPLQRPAFLATHSDFT